MCVWVCLRTACNIGINACGRCKCARARWLRAWMRVAAVECRTENKSRIRQRSTLTRTQWHIIIYIKNIHILYYCMHQTLDFLIKLHLIWFRHKIYTPKNVVVVVNVSVHRIMAIFKGIKIIIIGFYEPDFDVKISCQMEQSERMKMEWNVVGKIGFICVCVWCESAIEHPSNA